jgi:hypothetical protein
MSPSISPRAARSRGARRPGGPRPTDSCAPRTDPVAGHAFVMPVVRELPSLPTDQAHDLAW